MVTTISLSKIQPLIKDFMNVYNSDPDCRFRSYDYAHEAFKNKMYNKTVSDDDLAKELFIFLASWGMLRGSSFLLQKNYRFLIPIVQIVRNPKYRPLIDIDVFSLGGQNYLGEQNSSGGQNSLTRSSFIDLILELKELITKSMVGQTFYKYDSTQKSHVQTKITRISDTLIGKILLCVFGCIPAYDRYVRNTMSILGICNTISRQGLQDLLDWLNLQINEIKWGKTYCNASTTTLYSDMKVADIILWEYSL